MKLVSQKVSDSLDNDDPTTLGPGKTVIKISHSLWEGDNKIGATQSHRITGLNKTSGKRWFRWEMAGGVYVYRSEKTGFFYTKETSSKRWTSSVFLPDQITDDLMEVFAEKWGERPTFDSLYPMADNYRFNKPWNRMTSDYGLGWLRYPDAMSLTVAMFGKTRYRKDLVKSVAEATWESVLIARQFRGLVPIDWIINFLRINERGAQEVPIRRSYGQTNVDVRRQLLALDPRSYRALLRRNLFENDEWYNLSDAARAVNHPLAPRADAVHGRVRNWKEFHDLYVVRMNHAYQAPIEHRFDIPQTDIAKSIDGQMIGNLEIRTPKSVDDIRSWGEFMHNCIGSYDYIVARDNATSTVAAVMDGDKVLANLEVKNGHLHQLLGRFNQPLSSDRRDSIASALSAFDIDTSGSWWGKG